MQTCYACQKPATTKEHTPPLCLFPDRKDIPDGVDFRRNLITVPSCEEHNLKKSGDDEYLLYVLSTNLPANEIAQAQWTKLKRAVVRRPALWNSMCSSSEDVEVMDSQTGKIYEAVQIGLDGSRFQRSLELITLGIYCHHFGNHWIGNIRIHSDFADFPYESSKAEIDANRMLVFHCAEKLFASIPRHGDNQDVFWYQVYKPENSFRYLIRIGFYGRCTITAFLGEMNE
ncbi:MAG: hypothetical protein Q7T53_13135 [Deltaproteobacteria bacterium]|nr:hypothetical protein [Deltaproteobacteria bacterium]